MFFSSRRRHTRFDCDWSSDVCSSDLPGGGGFHVGAAVRDEVVEVVERDRVAEEVAGRQVEGDAEIGLELLERHVTSAGLDVLEVVMVLEDADELGELERKLRERELCP